MLLIVRGPVGEDIAGGERGGARLADVAERIECKALGKNGGRAVHAIHAVDACQIVVNVAAILRIGSVGERVGDTERSSGKRSPVTLIQSSA